MTDKHRSTPSPQGARRAKGTDDLPLRAPLLENPPTPKRKWLVSWIGATDLKAEKEEVEKGVGPVASALTRLPRFDRVLLLTNYDFDESSRFVSWAQAKAGLPELPDLLSVKLNSPIDYNEIYERVVDTLTSQGLPADDVELTFHLSPGTPAMSVNWILLSRTRFPARLIQTSRDQGVQTVDMPQQLADAFRPSYFEGKRELAVHLRESEQRFNTMVYESARMHEVMRQAHKLAKFGVPVLIHGETGTGKDMLAQEIHARSRAADGPFVPVNCGTLTSEMANSELFGHKRGAFTGAVEERAGCFERADGGTLFLDEIAELPLDIQVRLLRVLADGMVTRLGGTEAKKVTVRVVAASHRNLAMEVAKNRFREDLYYRLAVGEIALPPLRERGNDVAVLARHFIDKFNQDNDLNPASEQRELGDDALALLKAHTWPGNVRELYHTILRLSIRADGPAIGADDVRHCLPAATPAEGNLLERPLGNGFSLEALLAEVRRHYLERADEAARGGRDEAAALLGFKTPQTYANWRKRYLEE
jgi:DNA-binding NtrC family response regulator